MLKNGKPKGRYTRWKWINLVLIYRLARAGFSEEKIGQSLAGERNTLRYWKRKFAEVREVFAIVEREKEQEGTLTNYLFGKLTPNLQDLWSKLKKFEKERNGVVKMEMLLSDQGKTVRQQLFLHALAVCNYSPTKACQKVNISKKELDRWVNDDPEFAELVSEVEWHKGNFYEEMLSVLVKDRVPAAVIFANKRFNAERGYGEKSEVNVRVSGNVTHGVTDLSELMPFLGDEARLELLEAIRKLEQQKALKTLNTQPPDPISNISQQITEVVDA
jgi:hypothetical protein